MDKRRFGDEDTGVRITPLSPRPDKPDYIFLLIMAVLLASAGVAIIIPVLGLFSP